MTNPEFINAQAMHKAHPETFDVPTNEELTNLKTGDNVKVATGDERFWVEITHIEGDTITGTVNNDLLNTHIHGLNNADVISFEKKHIYSVYIP